MRESGANERTAGLFTALARHRTAFQVTADVVAWSAAIVMTTALRDAVRSGDLPVGLVAAVIGVAAVVQPLVGTVSGLYLGRWRFGSFEEVAAVASTALVTAAAVTVVDLAILPARSALALGSASGVVALLLMAAVRYVWRMVLESRQRPRGDDCRRLLVFGAGEGGAQVLRSLLRSPDGPFLPVALLDDDPGKRRLKIQGVPVLGTRDDLRRVAAETRADALLVAIPSASGDLVRQLTDLATGSGLEVKVVPSVQELLGTPVAAADIRNVTDADLLGRREIQIDLASIASYLTGRRVLVTGAGGSIGSELCRQLRTFAPSELVMVDRDESALHSVQLSLEGHGLLDSPDIVLLDLRDAEGVDRLFAERRPQVVFHAAALKHLPLLERYPGEAVKSNVWATLDLLEAARRAGVERFVNISTDKAARPASVLGYSKRITERLTAWYAAAASGTYVSVRFGNVLGSRGSVLPTFRAQIDAGGPVLVTDPDVTRYFMTVSEAVRLVIQAAAVGQPGEVLILDMGEPVPIRDVARRLIDLSGRPLDLVYTGLRPGEKLHEVRMGDGEPDRRPVHPLISHADVPPLEPAVVRDLDDRAAGAALIADLRDVSAGPSTTVDAVIDLVAEERALRT